MPDAPDAAPPLSVVTPTFNNEAVFRRSIEGWRRYGGARAQAGAA